MPVRPRLSLLTMPTGGVKRFATAALLASAVAFSSPVASQEAQVVDVPVAQAGAIAQAALRDGRTDVAFAIAQAMLARDPNDPQGHLIMAIIARGAGRLDTAETAATEAWRNAKTDAEHFDAAFIAADIAARQERLTSSQIWLRRADQYAPNEAAKQTVARAYQGVSTRNPLKVQLSFTIRPSDNLNNGSDPDSEVGGIFGLSGNTEPKVGGIEIGAGASLSYRLSESADQRTELIAQAYLRRAILDSDDFADFNATSFGPITRNEFDYATLSFGLVHRRNIFDDMGPTGFRGTVGASYFRNHHLSNFVEIGATQDMRAGENGLLRYGVTLRNERRFDSEVSSYFSQGISADWFSRTETGLQFAIGATLTNFDSDSGTVDGRQLQARGRVDLGRPIFGARPDLALSATFRDLPSYGLFGEGRTDTTLRATLGLTFDDVEWYGFQPRLELTASDTNSSDDLWDRRSYGLGATLVSRF